MPIDDSAAKTANNALASIPFQAMIGGPLTACIDAQAAAAQTTWKFIQEVGLNTDENGNKSAVNVSFQFIKEGKNVQLNIPLLTIVPIPYIAIKEVDINFKAKIDASASSCSTESSESSGGASSSIKSGWFVNVDIQANYSSKKDSKATQESKYSVEYTMDVAVKAGQDSMPAGLAKILDILGTSLTLGVPGGSFEANQKIFVAKDKNDKAMLLLSCRTSEGIDESGSIILPDEIGKNGSAFRDEGVQGNNRIISCNFLNLTEDKDLTFEAKTKGMDKKLTITFVPYTGTSGGGANGNGANGGGTAGGKANGGGAH